jgi:hypothetical protein
MAKKKATTKKADGLEEFDLRVISDATIYADVTIRAKTREEAEELALHRARQGELKFELSDNGIIDPRIGD